MTLSDFTKNSLGYYPGLCPFDYLNSHIMTLALQGIDVLPVPIYYTWVERDNC